MYLTIHFLSKERTYAKKGNKKGDEENEKNLCLNPFASKSLYGKFASHQTLGKFDQKGFAERTEC